MSFFKLNRLLVYFALMLTPLVSSAQINQPELSAQEKYLASVFLHKAKETKTPWQEKDAYRYAQGLFDILDSYSEQLGEDNVRIINEFLPEYAKEMAASLITNVTPPSIYIDAFLSEYNDRLSGLAQRRGPIFPDENTRFIIKAQIAQYVNEICQDLQSAGDIQNDDIEAIKENIILNMYKRADHPFRSEFKRPASPAEEELKATLKAKVSVINFADERQYGNNPRRSNNLRYRRMIQHSLVRSEILAPLVTKWQIEPILMPSKETNQLYEQAENELTGEN